MAIELAARFLPYTDEMFSTESKKALLTNQDFNWFGAHSVKIYKISTSRLTDYGRGGPASGNWSRYGAVDALDSATVEMILKNDRSFTFAIDALDEDETAQQLSAASALAREVREVVIPEVDTYTYGVMCANAGHKPAAKTLTADNIYSEILAASEALDNAKVPETGRVLVVTPSAYALMKKCKDITMETDEGPVFPLRWGRAGLFMMLWFWTIKRKPCITRQGSETDCRTCGSRFGRWSISRPAGGLGLAGGAETDDSIQAGFIALLSSVDSYDGSTGAKFSTWFFQHIRREFANACGQRIERNGIRCKAWSVWTHLWMTENQTAALLEILYQTQRQRPRFWTWTRVTGCSGSTLSWGKVLSELPENLRKVIVGKYWYSEKVDSKPHSAALRQLRHPHMSKRLLRYL